MKYLLDVNVPLAGIWLEHPLHKQAFSWLAGKNVVLCPIAELGYLRISSNKKAIDAPMEQARDLLEKFATERNAERIHDDLAPLDSRPKTSDQVTDCYLADLSAKHGFRLATFDENIKHVSVEVVPKAIGAISS